MVCSFDGAVKGLQAFYDSHWSEATRIIQFYCLKSMEYLHSRYLELHQSVHLFFREQQERIPKSSLIVYQLVAYLKWRRVADMIETGLLSHWMIPRMLEDSISSFNPEQRLLQAYDDEKPNDPIDCGEQYMDILKEIHGELISRYMNIEGFNPALSTITLNNIITTFKDGIHNLSQIYTGTNGCDSNESPNHIVDKMISLNKRLGNELQGCLAQRECLGVAFYDHDEFYNYYHEISENDSIETKELKYRINYLSEISNLCRDLSKLYPDNVEPNRKDGTKKRLFLFFCEDKSSYELLAECAYLQVLESKDLLVHSTIGSDIPMKVRYERPIQRFQQIFRYCYDATMILKRCESYSDDDYYITVRCNEHMKILMNMKIQFIERMCWFAFPVEVTGAMESSKESGAESIAAKFEYIDIFLELLRKLDNLIVTLIEDNSMETIQDKALPLHINLCDYGVIMHPMLDYVHQSKSHLPHYAKTKWDLATIGICSQLLPDSDLEDPKYINSEYVHRLLSDSKYAMDALNKAIQCCDTSPDVALIHELASYGQVLLRKICYQRLSTGTNDENISRWNLDIDKGMFKDGHKIAAVYDLTSWAYLSELLGKLASDCLTQPSTASVSTSSLIKKILSVVRFKLMIFGLYGQANDDGHHDKEEKVWHESLTKRHRTFYEIAVDIVLQLKYALTQSDSSEGDGIKLKGGCTYGDYYMKYLQWLDHAMDVYLLGYEVYEVIRYNASNVCGHQKEKVIDVAVDDSSEGFSECDDDDDDHDDDNDNDEQEEEDHDDDDDCGDYDDDEQEEEEDEDYDDDDNELEQEEEEDDDDDDDDDEKEEYKEEKGDVYDKKRDENKDHSAMEKQTKTSVLREKYEAIMSPCQYVLDIVHRFHSLESEHPTVELTVDTLNQPIYSSDKMKFFDDIGENDCKDVAHHLREVCDNLLKCFVLQG